MSPGAAALDSLCPAYLRPFSSAIPSRAESSAGRFVPEAARTDEEEPFAGWPVEEG